MIRAKLHQLQEGCILAEDVLGKTKKTIMPKNTVLTPALLNVLEKFLIEEVCIEPVLANGDPFRPAELLGQHDGDNTSNEQPISLYLKAVQKYKKAFQSWQSGSPIDIGEIRDIIIPLFDKFVHHRKELLTLYRYATKEDYLYHHAVSVGLLSGFLAKQLDYSKGDCYQIVLAGILSDCGMAKVDQRILAKKSALTTSEYEEVKQHTVFGYRMVQKITSLKEGVKLAVLQHHERNDGTGYPFGIRDRQIHPYSKIVAVADVYHAMTSERLYRRKQSPFKALEKIQVEHFGKLSMEAIQILLDSLINFHIGTVVKLSNGEMAEIVFMQREAPTRPIVKIVDKDEFLSLSEHRDIHIEEVID
ncbi:MULTISPECIES: HD-GYP domain-containing protein [unclassified Geobacillus]|uniref:HD-GYP domain-containing protein n=1 Tax=unclassified Geobacillus TaxID=2642459 RepID=UPI000BE2681E|nr:MULTISPECIES: HD-GYP domain-containing protein [unclassified Geobacillus]PDM39461.1 phosphohydrolase [Parageobacillus yumthangensis]RDV22169.1 HD-GYP domain-containing protein [Parageobacillus toebii]TXK91868.1 HD-GYP domain-containing protein [Parageobacillus sp. SY1]PUF88044.1 HD-GYP domain-containing protein [Geobacillus sp. LYN3]TXK86776.1 HD-GYP domain-containing protein [Geobacillus sp. AYS3]